MKIIESLFTKNNCYKVAKKMTPQGVVVHSTAANNPNLSRYCDNVTLFGVNKYGNHWNQATPDGKQICCHAFIGYDISKEVVVAHTLPYNYCCWNCGDGSKGSYNGIKKDGSDPAYIQFEICEDGLTDKTYFNKIFKVATEYCAYLVKEYNIPIEKIVSHKEANKLGYASAHGDPDHWFTKFGVTMDDFRDRVDALVNGEKAIVKTCTKRFKATSSAKIRATASANGTVLGNVIKGTTYDVDKVIYVNDNLKWLHIKGKGYSMFVDSDETTRLFTEIYSLYTRIVNYAVNFRKDMSTSAEKICTIPKGTTVSLVKYSGEAANGYKWYKVKYNGVYGYVVASAIVLKGNEDG